MVSLGFEASRDGHHIRSIKWSEQDDSRSRGNSSTSSSMMKYLGVEGTSRSGHSLLPSQRRDSSTMFADEHSVASFGSLGSSKSTESTLQRRKRKRSLCLFAIYLAVAAITFGVVLLWYLGMIFQPSVVTSDSFQGNSNRQGYDQDGRMLCNGSALNCHRRANEIMYATVHNAMSSREDSFLAYNNLLQLEDALMAGFRGLTIDSCDCERIGIQLCHGLCVAGFRKPINTFTGIVNFMKQNTHEVVIIEIEAGGESLGPLFDMLSQVPGFFQLIYNHPGPDEPWPTLKELIESDRRLIVFAHDDVSCDKKGQCPTGVQPTFKYAFQTPFSQKGTTELMDLKRTCIVSRGKSDAPFIISNHFAANDQGLPDIEVAKVVNSAENLQARLDFCKDFFNTEYRNEVINLLVVDFWNVGDTLAIVDKYNSELPVITESPSSRPSLSPVESSSPTEVLQPSTAPPVVTPQPSTSPTVSTDVPTSAVQKTTVPGVTPTANDSPGFDTMAPSASLTSLPLMETLQSSDPATTTAPTLSLISFFESIMDHTSSPTQSLAITFNPSALAPTQHPIPTSTQRPLPDNPVFAIDVTSMPMTLDENTSLATGFDEMTETQDSLVSSAYTNNETSTFLSESQSHAPTIIENQNIEADDDDDVKGN